MIAIDPAGVLERAREQATRHGAFNLRLVAAMAVLEGAIRSGDDLRARQSAIQLVGVAENILPRDARYIATGTDEPDEDEGDEAA